MVAMRLFLLLLVCVTIQGRRLPRNLPPCTTTVSSTVSHLPIPEFLMSEDKYAALNRSGRPEMTTTEAPPHCNISLVGLQHPELPEHGLCPWSYVTDYDPNRYPSVIKQAKCACQSCRDPASGVEKHDTTCQELKYNIKVLKLVNGSSSNGYVKWKFDKLEVTVGCACLVSPLQ